MTTPTVAVLMPTYKQAAFIRRALASLLAQSLVDWELVIVDDGSPDDTAAAVAPYLGDPRVRYHRFPANEGLGAALNDALDATSAPYVAYLPSDDVYYPEHLATLAAALDAAPDAVLAHSGARYHYSRWTHGTIPDQPLQLVQVMHRRGPERWPERSTLETDDLDWLYWDRLRMRGPAVSTEAITCEWVEHPRQRHKIMQEPFGGINLFRTWYNVREPLRFQSTIGNFSDEVARYRAERDRPDTPPAPDALKILLVGELAYNADRILALEERGQRLYGLWIDEPQWYNTVGPLPFGHVTDLPRHDWQQAVRRLQPDVIYALLNWEAVPLAAEVRRVFPGIPFVWHFKEGPFICLEKGLWPDLITLQERADALIYPNAETRAWFEAAAPQTADGRPVLLLDGDLPRRTVFAGVPDPRPESWAGEIHTLVPGRPLGLHAPVMAALAAHDIHVHLYGDYTHGQWRDWIEAVREVAPAHLHLHSNVDPDGWVREFTRYDAGWLHYFPSFNGGDLHAATWDDLNYPARLATFAAAGLPMLQLDNPGASVATQRLLREQHLGVLFAGVADLAARLRDVEQMACLRRSVREQRDTFTFDHHADRLISFFRAVAAGRAAEVPHA